MAAMNAIQVTIGSDFALVPNGLGGTKKITLHEFIQEITTACEDQKPQDSSKRGVLYKYPKSMVSVEEGNNFKHINMYFPECRTDILHTNADSRLADGRRAYKDCVIPNIVISVYIVNQPTKEHKNRWVLQGNVYWLATPLSFSDVAMQQSVRVNGKFSPLPFNNQYEDGHMCTGGNSLQSVYYTDFSVAETLYNVTLLGSSFNSDLGLRGIGNFSGADLNQDIWYKYLQYCNDFPYQHLRGIEMAEVAKVQSSGTDITYKEFAKLTSTDRNKLVSERINMRAAKDEAIKHLMDTFLNAEEVEPSAQQPVTEDDPF